MSSWNAELGLKFPHIFIIFTIVFGSLLLLPKIAYSQAQTPCTDLPTSSSSSISPEEREAIFWCLINATFDAVDVPQTGLLLIGTGSWMNPNRNSRASDIDATIAYANDNLNKDQTWTYREKFYELKNAAEEVYGSLDITLFVDIRSEGEPDYYRGAVGQYFLYTHSEKNNSNSTFEISRNSRQSRPTAFFWQARNLKIPDSIHEAYLFVEDNYSFLDEHLSNQENPAIAAKLIAKYLARVEITLKEEIQKKWDAIFLFPDPDLTTLMYCIGNIGNLAGPRNEDFDTLDLIPLDQLEKGVRACFGLSPTDDLFGPVENFYFAAEDYFLLTRDQVKSAEPQELPTPLPSPIPSPTTTATIPNYDWDKPFNVPQFFLHATGHGTVNGPVTDDYYFLFPNPPVNGSIELPDGTGGTFTYSIDLTTGPFTTPRQVCSIAKNRGIGNRPIGEFGSTHTFDCSQLP